MDGCGLCAVYLRQADAGIATLARDAWEKVPWGEDEGRGAAPSPREGTSPLSKPIQRQADAGIATLARDAWAKVP